MSDCWRPEERGTAVSIYSLAPLLGPGKRNQLSRRGLLSLMTYSNRTNRWRFYQSVLKLALDLLRHLNCRRFDPDLWDILS